MYKYTKHFIIVFIAINNFCFIIAVKDRFNSDYVNSQYYFVGNLLIKAEGKDAVYTTNSKMFPSQVKGSKIIFEPNKNYDILGTLFSLGKIPDDNFKLPPAFNFDPNKKPENRTMVLSPFSEHYPTVVITQKNSELLVLIGKPNQGVNGTKLIFNVSAFEKRMRGTSWYDNLDQKDRRLIFGLGVDADKANFLGTNSFPINIIEIWGVSKLDYPLSTAKFIRAIAPIVSATRLSSYDELYKGPNPIISITPMNSDDYTLFNQLIKSNK